MGSRAVRLVFTVGDGGVQLVSRQRVEMTLLPADGGAPDSIPDFAAEVRRQDGAVLHRVAMQSPLEPHLEVFSPDPEQTIRRVEVEGLERAFTVVVPDHPDGEHVALLAAPPAGSGLRAALSEVAVAPLRGPDFSSPAS